MEQKNWHAKSTADTSKQLNSSAKEGLSEAETGKRIKAYGLNKLREKKQKSLWKLILDQFKSAVIYLLIIAVIVSFAFGDIPEAIAIIVVILLNTVIGFYMEYQARSSMKALKKMDKMTSIVLRDGEKKEIDAEGLVPGDLIVIESGQLVPADCRVVEQSELQVNESALTGESFPVDKHTGSLDEDTPLADRTNMIFKGTSITKGKGRALVVATGMETEIGDISRLVSEEDEESVPLTIKLNELSKKLIWIVLGMAVAYGIFGYLSGKELHIIAQTSLAWAIAAIPEGLAIVATIALAKGMLRLSREQVIVKRLAAVETLGETTTILTDKTGTLTQNKLSLEHVNIENFDKKSDEISGDNQEENEQFDKFLRVAVLCNNAGIDKDGNEKGDTVEISLMQFAEYLEKGLYEKIKDKNERVDEDPFDSESMFMTTMHRHNGNYFYALKGAANRVIDQCTEILTKDGTKKLTEETAGEWVKKHDRMAADGLRTLGFAYKETNEKESLEGDFVFIGLAGFLDPPAEGVKDAIDTCRKAGISVVMVTGDHPETSKNIARQVGITDEDDPEAFTGKDVEGFKESEREKFHKARIFARVDPGQKLDVLNVFKSAGDIVGMTGDGVNDAPALKKADIGIAMGKRGTQVAQAFADMVLKDDNFASIVTAIREGRIIFSNIRKFVIYQLSYHLSEILVIAAISFTVMNLPLLPLQLLFLNLLVDVFPALALGVSPGMPNVMKLPPKDPEESILTKQSWMMISSHGVIIAVWVIAAYFAGLFYLDVPKEIANNIAFFSLAFTQLLHVFDMRDRDEPFFKNQVTRNKYVWYAIAFCAVVILAAYFIPGLNSMLSFQPMGTLPWILVVATMLLSVGSIQALKKLKVIQ